MKLITFILLFLNVCRSHVVVEAIWEEILTRVPEERRALYQNSLSEVAHSETKIVEEVIYEKQKTRGEKYVEARTGGGKKKIEELLAKNRQKLKSKSEDEHENLKLEDFAKKNEAFLKGKSQKVKNQLLSWREKNKETLKEWSRAREKFIKQIKEYKKTTFEIPIEITPALKKKVIKKEITITTPKNFHVVQKVLEIPIKDQKRRATCSSFAGIRAIETISRQKGESVDLSEHYFYWASKPKCQRSPCSTQGSWVGYGLEYSKEKGIPLEKDCPYIENRNGNNETFTPVSSNCHSHVVKVDSYKTVETLDETISELEENRPVIAGLKLKENFYQNKGIVFLTDKLARSSGSDSHASGHAVLFIGYIKLPPELHQKEGKLCFLTANSWGIGWGLGGHACLSEKWVLQNRGRNPFVSVTSVSQI